MTVKITHSHAEGTLLDGTSRGRRHRRGPQDEGRRVALVPEYRLVRPAAPRQKRQPGPDPTD